jgi:hypothetical protein
VHNSPSFNYVCALKAKKRDPLRMEEPSRTLDTLRPGRFSF